MTVVYACVIFRSSSSSRTVAVPRDQRASKTCCSNGPSCGLDAIPKNGKAFFTSQFPKSLCIIANPGQMVYRKYGPHPFISVESGETTFAPEPRAQFLADHL